MEFFHRLGDLVGHRWKERNYNEAVFPEVAAQALLEFPPNENSTLWDVLKPATTAEVLPFQADLEAHFGDPPLTVYLGRGFRIEVLSWIHGVPSVHQHSFSGAFHVMQGSSVHTMWDFQPEETLETRLLLGKVVFRSAEILEAGDTRTIIAGKAMYHATFHLDRPSISVVVRTLGETDKQPQYQLLPPCAAFASLDLYATVVRQQQLLGFLNECGKRAELVELARHIVATRDAYSTFVFLRTAARLVQDELEFDALFQTARAKHPNLAHAIQSVIRHEAGGSRVVALSRATSDDHLRYFVALIRNIPERNSIFQLLEKRYPGCDIPSKIVSWIRQLSNEGSLGFAFQESWLFLLEEMLRDKPHHIVHARFHEYCDMHRIVCSSPHFEQLVSSLRSSWLLKPLFPATAISHGAPISEKVVTSLGHQASEKAA